MLSNKPTFSSVVQPLLRCLPRLLSICFVALLVSAFAQPAEAKPRKKGVTAQQAKAGKRKGQVVVVRKGRNGKLVAVKGAAGGARAGKVAVRKVVMVKGKRRVVTTWVPARPLVVAEPPRPSAAQNLGLRGQHDALDLKSSVALVIDQNTNEVLYEKNTHAVLPIASITKLMTALVVVEAKQPMQDMLQITTEDRDLEKGSRSRLREGTQMTREEMLRLALMSSENRAASALGRNYPGGQGAFVQAMNRKAQELGMKDTHYVDPTGLSSKNVSSAADLTKMVNAAYRHPVIRQFSTQPDHHVSALGRDLQFVNTNRLVRGGDWDIGLQKTGFITEAGRCLVMQAKVHGRAVVMVFLDSVGKLSRFGDAVRVKNWLESASVSPAPARPVAGVVAAKAS